MLFGITLTHWLIIGSAVTVIKSFFCMGRVMDKWKWGERTLCMRLSGSGAQAMALFLIFEIVATGKLWQPVVAALLTCVGVFFTCGQRWMPWR